MASTVVKPEPLAYEQARERVLDAAAILAARLVPEAVPLDEAVGRVLAEPLVAVGPLPPFDNSAVDGYALRSTDVAEASAEAPLLLQVLETVGAGRVATMAVGHRQATRVMTGAPLPAGADCTVAREQVRESADDEVWVSAPVAPGQNVRPRGEDLIPGETGLPRGHILGPADIALAGALAGPGPAISVMRRPRVAVLSTGDELREPGEPLGPGQIHDSSSYALRAMIREAGGECGETWRLGDDPEIVGEAMEALLAIHDLVLAIGGVSAGDFDPVKLALRRFPTIGLWRVAMRPGGPQAFGRSGHALFYGLPGNPVSSAVVFDRFVRPLVRAALGARPADRPTVRARLAEPVRSARGRREFARVRLEGQPGAWRARLTGSQSSGAISSIARADGLAVIPEPVATAEAGSEVDVLLWNRE